MIQSEKKHIDSLQGLRAIAFLMVLLGHCSVKGTLCLGGAAVSIFFVLSGFVLDYSYNDRLLPSDILHSICFAKERINKLYILHIILLIAMIILEIIADGFNFEFAPIALNALLLQSWFYNTNILHSYNGITWYLSDAVFFYFLFPYVENRIRKKRGGCIVAICAVFSILIIRIMWSYLGSICLNDSVYGWFQYFFPLTRMWEFIIGILVGYIYRLCRVSKVDFGVASILETLSVIFFVFSWQLMQYVVEWARYIVILPSIIFLVFFLAQSKGCVSYMLSSEILTRLGNISGKLYIIHYVVLSYICLVLYRFGKETTSPVVVAIITFLFTLLGTNIYSKVESVLVKPFEKWKICHRK